MKILIVEDEQRLATLLKKGLEEHSYAVDLCFDGEEGLYMAETFPYDAVLLDVMLPKMDGFTVLDTLRKQGIEVPVLMLTARTEVESRVKGLNRGADDYIPKPFDFIELLARLTAVIRRNKGQSASAVQIADLSLDLNAKTASRAGREIVLSAKEYAVLEYLVLNKGRVISRTEFSEHVYDGDFDLDSNIIDVYINKLRKKIDKGHTHALIQTKRGVGYYIPKEEQ
ncbi:MAG: DNA-binding response regulator [Candidatus Electrothrix sp. AX5]|jgi:DNA-binding response OmpR family regulator|uniref:Two component transcriptional regulator, winged helix family n=1 Tax=Candidatus Electrothrix aarhusensis TaxID=1859131 RepID=A0A3S3QFI2_9BACT|nr:DNA-binding response regulator [Candidatus Electrothrix sp. AX5]RWX46128.1 two component transcriptional regulator, winged helix family [Candidatus Electrothrix aarhusensis]